MNLHKILNGLGVSNLLTYVPEDECEPIVCGTGGALDSIGIIGATDFDLAEAVDGNLIRFTLEELVAEPTFVGIFNKFTGLFMGLEHKDLQTYKVNRKKLLALLEGLDEDEVNLTIVCSAYEVDTPRLNSIDKEGKFYKGFYEYPSLFITEDEVSVGITCEPVKIPIKKQKRIKESIQVQEDDELMDELNEVDELLEGLD